MTAANLWIGGAAAYILSDTAFTAPDDGSVDWFQTKVHTSAALRIAISQNGWSSPLVNDAIAEWLDSHTCQEAAMHDMPLLVEKLSDSLRRSDQLLAEYPEWAHRRPAEDERGLIQLFIAIWSVERQQPEAYVIGSQQGTLPSGAWPRRLFGVSSFISPDVDPAFMPQCNGGPDLHFDPHRDGLRLIKEQRFTPGLRGHLVVGGCAELTTVDAEGARTELVASWPDHIGRPIQPRWYERWKRWAISKLPTPQAEVAISTAGFGAEK